MTAPQTARLWCTCVITDYLIGDPRSKDACDQIVGEAVQGRIEIWISALALAEVAHLGQSDYLEAEATISAFFQQDYVKVIQLDRQVAQIARELIRAAHQQHLSIRGADAVHVASAIQHEITVFESTDQKLLNRLNQMNYSRLAGLAVRQPTYEGPAMFRGMGGP